MHMAGAIGLSSLLLFFGHERFEDECDCQQCANVTHTAVRGKWRHAATSSCNEGRSPSEPPGGRRSSRERAKALGQLTHEVDCFQRPTDTNLSSQHDETSPAMCTRAPGTLTLWLDAPAPKRLRRGCPSALTGDTSVVSTASWALPTRGSPSTPTSKATTVHPGCWQIDVADEDIHGHATTSFTTTIPDWQ